MYETATVRLPLYMNNKSAAVGLKKEKTEDAVDPTVSL